MTTTKNFNKDQTPQQKETNSDALINEPTINEPKASRLTLDVDYYQSFLDDTDIPEHKKQEFIEALWSIITAFVDLGFGIHPVQQATKQNTELSTSDHTAKIITTVVDEWEENEVNN